MLEQEDNTLTTVLAPYKISCNFTDGYMRLALFAAAKKKKKK